MLQMKFILILFVLMLTACGGGSQAVAPVGTYRAKSQQAPPPSVYKVRRGDTLFSVSWRYGMDFKEVARINGIRSPYTIYVGQKLRFKPYRKVASKPKKTVSSKTKHPTKVAKPTNRQASSTSNQRLAWRWPVEGKVISTYSKSAAGRKGIDIAGKSGQKVAAAASGKVVYSGSGLPRYGNLIIIKHNDAYLSAYAHNKNLLVKEGQWVKTGQKIALLGRTGAQRDQLHFEIRRNGKPVDPMRFLPKR
jgi:lipoprotein NlpD